MNMNGIHCQVSPIMTAIRAPQGSTTQESLAQPKYCQIGASGPLAVSVSMRNM